MIAGLIAALVIAVVAYRQSRAFWVSFDMTQIGGIAIKDNPTGTPNE